MHDYRMDMRHAMLEVTEDLPTQERADALNLLEMIIEDDFDVDEMIERIGSGTVPVRYKVKDDADDETTV